MNNFDHQAIIFDMMNHPSKIDQCNISTYTDFLINPCHQNYFDSIQTVDILQNLNKLKDFREHFRYEDFHPYQRY
jgi:hypothetical protein